MAEPAPEQRAEEQTHSGGGAARPRVIYVMGAGHSGSTILGVALGNCEGVFYAGEVEEWLSRGGESPIGGTERVRFWAEVSAQVTRSDVLSAANVHRSIERSSAVLRPAEWRQRRRLQGDYRRVTEDLYRAIAKASHAGTIVDSSHFPLRARELQALSGIDVYLLFLVRDPQAVVSSELRGIHRHNVAERRVRMLVTNANLWLTNLLSVLVFRRQAHDRRLFVSHEEFLADPAGALRRVLDLVGSSAALPDLDALRTGFPLLGNKLIHSELVALRRAAGPPPRQSLLTGILQAPWAPVLARMTPRVGAAPERPEAAREFAPPRAR